MSTISCQENFLTPLWKSDTRVLNRHDSFWSSLTKAKGTDFSAMLFVCIVLQ